MTTFVLVHGAFHGAWCWRKVQRSLEDLGHPSIAVELPCADDGAGVTAYAEAVVAAIPSDATDVVAVGHSLGGITIPVVAHDPRVRHLVFLAALVPEIGRSFFESMSAEQRAYAKGMMDDIELDAGGLQRLAPERAVHWFYSDCEPVEAEWAAGQLRGQAVTPLMEVSPLTRWADVTRTYILCRDDRVVSPSAARVMAEQLGVAARELPGSHSPFLSRPEALAQLLVECSSPSRSV